MKKLKDFFYNWNDILVVLLILAFAALLIYWRVNVIMDYPKVLAASVEVGMQPNADGTSVTDNGNTSTEKSAENEDSGNTEEDGTDSGDTGDTGAGPANSTIWKDGKLRANMTVTIESGSASGAVNSLVEAGLFNSYEEFNSVCQSVGTEATAILATTYTFNSGATQGDIALQVTGN